MAPFPVASLAGGTLVAPCPYVLVLRCSPQRRCCSLRRPVTIALLPALGQSFVRPLAQPRSSAARAARRDAGIEFFLEHRAHPFADGEIPAIDDGETEAARRHGMRLARDLVVEGDLNRRHVGDGEQVADPRAIDLPVDPMGAEEHDAVADAALLAELPDAVGVELDHGGKPALAVEVEPLLGHAQMAFDDAAADRLDIDDAGEAAESAAEPFAEISFEHRLRLGMNG